MPWYNNGTVAVTNNTIIVTGTGTAWIANAASGMGFRGPDREIYEIASVNSDTQLTLATPYQGGTASGQAYSLLPTQDYMRSLAQQVAALIGQFGTIANNAGQGRFGDGTAAAPGITFGADQSTGFYRIGPSAFGVATGGNLRQMWDTSGNMLVGYSAASTFHRIAKNATNNYALGVYNDSATNGYGLRVSSASAASTNWAIIEGWDNTTLQFQVLGNGTTLNRQNSWGGLSDLKLKQDITDATPKLADLMRVRIVNYRFKSDPTHKQLGVVAQELEQVFPGLIDETPDFREATKTREVPAVFDDEGNEVTPSKTEEYTEREPTGEVTKSVKYSIFVPMLIKAMQEQQALIESLAARVAALESA